MTTPLGYLGARHGWMRVEEVRPWIVQLRLSTQLLRRAGLRCTPYLVDDVMVDTGFSHVRGLVMDWLVRRDVSAVALTHHHEDHPGNAGPLAERYDCPVYLRNAGQARAEGVGSMPAYRRLYWGAPGPYAPVEMPDTIQTSRRTLRTIPTPGHSVTHTALFDESDGVVFVGDLYISPGVTAVMRHENPFENIASLRCVADLEPDCLLNGHGLTLDKPARRLRQKADRVESAAQTVMELRGQGRSEATILAEIFEGNWRQDRTHAAMTFGEFCRRNFVRAVIRHAP
jgi:endoribonuclease LACTB2